MSKNTALTELYCNDNQLTNLDVSDANVLGALYCQNNQLTSLSVSKSTVLSYLICFSNQLTSLDVSKNTSLTTFWGNSNPFLKIICVNENQNTSNWIKDDTAEFSTTCSPITSTPTTQQIKSTIIKAYNLQGIEVPIDTKNQFIILLYDNGQTKKVFVD